MRKKKLLDFSPMHCHGVSCPFFINGRSISLSLSLSRSRRHIYRHSTIAHKEFYLFSFFPSLLFTRYHTSQIPDLRYFPRATIACNFASFFFIYLVAFISYVLADLRFTRCASGPLVSTVGKRGWLVQRESERDL